MGGDITELGPILAETVPVDRATTVLFRRYWSDAGRGQVSVS
jgi:hypothetical protein